MLVSIRRRFIRLAAIASLSAFTMMLSPPSFAEDEPVVGNATGGGEVPGDELDQSPAELARLNLKLAEASDYRSSQIRVYTTGKDAPNDAESGSTPVPTVFLGVTHSGQIEYYYCGPTSGFMMMRFKQAGASAYNGASLTQGNMAGPDHMRTDINGSTPFTYDTMRIGLNRWRSGQATGFYQTLADPSDTQFKDAFVSDIGGYNMPLAVSTIEYAGGIHYNFHPNQLIGHWLVGNGFRNFADDGVGFLDPAANASGLSSSWNNVRERFEPLVGTFNRRHVSYVDHGITW